jgi:tRNA (Thr-GGU) A37 N-methylase
MATTASWQTGMGLVMFLRKQLGKPVPSPVVLVQLSEKFREAVKNLAEREWIPVYQFRHKERKDDIANEIPPAASSAGWEHFHGCGARESTGFQRPQD